MRAMLPITGPATPNAAALIVVSWPSRKRATIASRSGNAML
jgi:hypothetical protein